VKRCEHTVGLAVLAVCVVTILLLSTVIHSPSSTAAGTSTWVDPAWSGEVVNGTNKSVTAVAASWTIPTIVGSCPTGVSELAFVWIGIDGWWPSTTVEQIGTISACQTGVPTYYAVYEFYPSSWIQIPLAVNPGEQVEALVDYNWGTFNLNLFVVAGQFNISQPFPSADRSSGEFIVEAPNNGSAPLPDIGNVTFSSAEVLASGTTTYLAYAPGLLTVDLVDRQGGSATPTDLSSGSFTVVTQGPAAQNASVSWREAPTDLPQPP
jgi:hypothetical protein